MKQLLIVLSAVLAAASASAAEYSGKCAKEAADAAVKKWADVPSPNPDLEYVILSSKAKSTGSSEYTVELGFYDSNESSRGEYTVTFAELSNCSGAVANWTK